MEIETFSILAGSSACNARCPFCISKMTPPLGVELKEPEINWHNFHVACRLAKQCNVTTVMITSKGEPTLFPDQITKFLDELKEYNFLIEMQTNGIPIFEQKKRYDPYLKEWHARWLTTMAISIVHYDPEKNRQIYLPYKKAYIHLPELITLLHSYGFSIRLTCIAANGFIDSDQKLERLLEFAKVNAVEQLTLTPVNKPKNNENKEAWDWTNAHHLTDEQFSNIQAYIEKNGTKLRYLSHGAPIYDIDGQNLCLNHCLTFDSNSKELRNLIFFPDGHVRSHWEFPGSLVF